MCSKSGEYVFSECKNLSKITFEGDVPEISSYAFDQVKATCYYPKGNTTYTAEITTQDFGGDLIWTYEGEEANQMQINVENTLHGHYRRVENLCFQVVVRCMIIHQMIWSMPRDMKYETVLSLYRYQMESHI